MNKPILEELEKEAIKKRQKRDKKRGKKMKVDSASLKNLSQIIKDKK